MGLIVDSCHLRPDNNVPLMNLWAVFACKGAVDVLLFFASIGALSAKNRTYVEKDKTDKVVHVMSVRWHRH